MAWFFKVPFASSGTVAPIPNASQPDGSVSYTEGFPLPYQLNPATEPSALDIPRDQFNQLMNAITGALQVLQVHGFPDFITSADNGGSPYSYDQNATVRYNGLNYYSLVDLNMDTPPSAKWGLVSYSEAFQTGDMLPWAFSTIRSGGWLWLNGTTIGSAASNATQRANADTQNVYTRLWNDYSSAVLPIYTSAGTLTTRGVSAAADFAANKALATPDWRGRSLFGADNMGGAAAAGRITTALSGISGTTIGASGGLETVQLTSNQNGTHLHSNTLTDPGHIHAGSSATIPAHQHYMFSNITAGNRPVTESPSSSPSYQGDVNGNSVYSYTMGYRSDNPSLPATVGLTNAAGGGTASVSINSATTGVTINNASSGLGSDHQNMPPAGIIGGWIMKL